MAPFVEALLDAAHAGRGCAVLDVACGTGFVAREAAVRVGPAGRVAGIDLNPGMLAVAAAASDTVTPAIEWHHAPADDLPFPEATFDAVVCQQGLQFVPDLQAAVDEAARVARVGGRVVATVWSPLERSPYFEAQFRAVRDLLGDDASASFADAFGCAADRLAAAFRAAGLTDVEHREVVADIGLPPLDEFAPGHLAALPWGAAVAEAHPDGLTLAAAAIAEQLTARRAPDGSVTAPFASALVAGTR
jgi:SAM-dependent methyltransferase